jgi:hypothetical protein
MHEGVNGVRGFLLNSYSFEFKFAARRTEPERLASRGHGRVAACPKAQCSTRTGQHHVHDATEFTPAHMLGAGEIGLDRDRCSAVRLAAARRCLEYGSPLAMGKRAVAQ